MNLYIYPDKAKGIFVLLFTETNCKNKYGRKPGKNKKRCLYVKLKKKKILSQILGEILQNNQAKT